MSNDAVSQLRSETQKAMEAHLADLDVEDNATTSDPTKRERRRSEIMIKLEKAYALGKKDLIRSVARALQAQAKSEQHALFRDKQGFSAYRFAKKVATIRGIGQQVADLQFQGEERLRELYVSLVLKIGKAVKT